MVPKMDGEAETGPTAGAWHSNKFLNPATDGAVLPILHLNGFKIANPTIFGTMADYELNALFIGYGYLIRIVELSDRLDHDMDAAMTWAYNEIRTLQKGARSGNPVERPRWPMLILRTPKEARTNPNPLAIVETWLRSYRPEELFDSEGRPAQDILSLCPKGDRRMATNPHSFGGRMRRPLRLPPLSEYGVDLTARGKEHASGVEELGKYLRDLIRRNREERNFRIVCPDELESNRLEDVLSATRRQYVWPLPDVAEVVEHTGKDGLVLEVLSEHNCQGWLQGYLLTGRHGLF